MLPGHFSEDELTASTSRGLYVTDMMGFGFNPVTGDFSRGASGFWLEDGKMVHPVSEVTISANMDALLKNIEAVATAPKPRSSMIVPAFRVTQMTIAGS
jgi:PmbA protein